VPAAPTSHAPLTEILSALVDSESPSADVDAVAAAQRRLSSIGYDLTGTEPTWIDTGGAPSIAWHHGEPGDPARILLLGHVDTVWPLGTLDHRPFEMSGERATGPGVFDMKAGLAVALVALARLPKDLPVSLLVTGDEEIGSPASRELVEEHARRAQACLVLEGAGPEGAVKSARKGWSFYTYTCRGRAAHAGLEPHRGVNALLGLARVVRRLEALGEETSDATVTPTVARAGTTVNTVPAHAEVTVDVRSATPQQQSDLDDALRALTGRTDSGVEIGLDGGVNRPPMTKRSAGPVLARLRQVAVERGWPVPEDVAVGGISDANLTAAAGTPTLDGLGAVGGGAHADDEWVDLPATHDRIDLVAALAADLAERPLTDLPDDESARQEGTR
jgi:glutamate carboxypeptidase